MTTLNSEEITLCSNSVHQVGIHLPLSLNDNTEQWRDHSVLWQCDWGESTCLWVWMTTLNSDEITLCSDSVEGGVPLPFNLNDNIEQWRDHSVLWQCWLGGWSICLWVWMTTLNIEEINLCSGSVLHTGCQSTFESEWKHWTVKRLLYALTVLTGGLHLSFSLNGYIEQWRDQLCSQIVLKGGVLLPLNLNDNIEQWRDHSVLWQCFAHRGSICLWVWMTTLNSEEITLCSDSVDQVGVHLPLSLNDNTEQWRDHSVLWQCWLGGPSAFESEWQHWTVKRSICALTVLKGGHLPFNLNDNIEQWRDHSVLWQCWWRVYLSLSLNDNIEQWRDHSVLWQCFAQRGSICFWVWMTTLNSEEITLCSDNVLHQGGSTLPLSLNDNIEQWRDHPVLWQCWLGGPSVFESQWQHWTVRRSLCALDSVLHIGGWFCLLVSMTTLNSEEINLCSDYVDQGESHLPLSLNDNIEQWRDHSVLWQCWLGGVPLPLNLNDNIEQWRDNSVLWQCWRGCPSAFQSEWQNWTVKR